MKPKGICPFCQRKGRVRHIGFCKHTKKTKVQLANPFDRPLPTAAELTGKQYTSAVARFK